MTATTRAGQGGPPASTPSRRKRFGRPRRETLIGWLFLLPALLFYGLFVLQPLGLTIQYSFYDWNGVGPATSFVH